MGTSGTTDIVSGLAGLALFGWLALRPRAVLGMWGPLAAWLPDLGRVFGVVVEDGEPRFSEPAERFWRGFARFLGIFGVVVAAGLIVQGVGKLR
jgi:hypothetical protein